MINDIVMGIIKMVIGLINLVLSPLDNLILTAIPQIHTALTNVTGMFNIVSQTAGWVVSLLGIPQEILSLVIAYYTFSLTIPYIVYSIKLAIKWYNALKP